MNAISPSQISSPRPDGPLSWLLPAVFLLALVPAAWSAATLDPRAAAAPPRFAALEKLRAPKLKPPSEAEGPPPVEALVLAPIEEKDAVEINAAVPFSKRANPPARPFVLRGDKEMIARSTDCLAAAVLYEAGDDTTGQRAVAQVVLNRMRHPAYPRTVCGVVFQGSERRTGCQFTFTCDGALNRSWSPAAWGRARDVARQALNGYVYKKVGWSTHYHTNWVVPYWSASLDKVAAVDTHLFFRWTGWWGTAPAFRHGHAGVEPRITKLARIFATHDGGAGEGEETEGTALAEQTLEGVKPATPRDLKVDGGTFLVRVRKGIEGDRIAALALETCGDRAYCKFMAWNDKDDMPAAFPVPPAALDTMVFSYLRNQRTGFDKPLWNCERYERDDPRQCMKRRATAMRVKIRKDDDKKDDKREAERRAERSADAKRSFRPETLAKPSE